MATREEHSWKLRQQNEPRFFGGRNVGFFGDMWQFPPVRQSAIFSDPFRCKADIEEEKILALFWTKGVDSIRQFYELTTEVRCKDPWISLISKPNSLCRKPVLRGCP